MKTATDRKRTGLMRRYRGLIKKLGISEEERIQMLSDNYGVESSKDLYVEELELLCNVLQSDADKKDIKLQDARNRVFGSVGGWLDMLYGYERSEERKTKIKAIACRQTEYKDFNKIPIERLNNVSYTFSKKQKDYKRGELVAETELATLAYLN